MRFADTALPLCLASAIAVPAIAQQLGAPQAYSQQTQQPSAYAQQPNSNAQQPPTQGQLGAPQQIGGVQQPGALQVQPPGQQQPVAPAPQMPPGFPLNALQEASLDQVLDAWQQQSSQIITFNCAFERFEYVLAFGPVINGRPEPLNKNLGELTYAKPDKGSFKITQIKAYKQVPAPAGQPAGQKFANWVVQPEAIGEHWVCDGKSVFEFRTDQKQVIERPLPPRAPGQTIIDGPLPFLFGAEKEKLKQRYWMKLDEQAKDSNQIWLTAWPKFQEQAADIRTVEVILDRKMQLPQAMRVTMPNGDYHVYKFQIENAKINATFDRMKNALFERPSIPFGWKLVLESQPVAQAQQGQPDAPLAR